LFSELARQKLGNLPAQSFQFDDQLIFHGVIDAADMENYPGDKYPLCAGDRFHGA
jgi:hypothetical protein